MSLSVTLYDKLHCGFEKIVSILSTLNDLLGWNFKSLPNRNSIENWVKKSGYYVYHSPSEFLQTDNLAAIVDESMMMGSEKLLITLGTPASHPGHPLLHSDVHVLGLHVASSWNSRGVCDKLKEMEGKVGHAIEYVISDNASVMNSGIRLGSYTQIRDISHTLGMFLERLYKKDDEFNSYMKSLANVKFRDVMKPIAYLLPPKLRTIARFLNLSDVAKWSSNMLENFHKLTDKEKDTFSFIHTYASFIDEFSSVMSCVKSLEQELKHKGLSGDTVLFCRKYILKELYQGNGRMRKLAEDISLYLMQEHAKLLNKELTWNISSDIIESIFGTYKQKRSPNLLNGVTPFVLYLPLHTQIHEDKRRTFDFKRALEKIYMADIEQWKKINLTDNLVYKRIKTLKRA